MARIMCAVAVVMIAATVLQAAALEVPHPAEALGQKKIRQLGKLTMKDPSSMLTELEEMVHSGETPTFDVVRMIKSTIQDDIMPGLQATRDAAANETADRLAAIELCNDESKARADQIAGSTQVSVNIARSAHAVCRDTQKSMYYHNLTSPESYCVKLGEFLDAIESLSITGLARADAVDYVKSASMNANMCSASEVCELGDNCTQKEEELHIKDIECTAKQRAFEVAFCTWKTESHANCQELDSCHSTAVANYQHHVSQTEILLEKWNIETGALQKILCYCNVWLSDMDDDDNRSQHNATQFEVCKGQTYFPAPVDHGTPADKALCPLTHVECHPGKSCFNQEYSSFAEFVAPVVPCLMPTTRTTTAMPTQGVILTADVSAGSTEIEVNNQTGFQLGQTVDIDPGTAVHETNVISEFGSIIFITPLVFNHSINARVVGQAMIRQGGSGHDSHDPCASVCPEPCMEADAGKPECTACDSCHQAHDPCAALCLPQRCLSWDDANKTECAECAACHRQEDPCSEMCWEYGCHGEAMNETEACMVCFACHSSFEACDGKAQRDSCEVWWHQDVWTQWGAMSLAQNNDRQPDAIRLRGHCEVPLTMESGNDSSHEVFCFPEEPVHEEIEACKGAEEDGDCSFSYPGVPNITFTGRCTHEAHHLYTPNEMRLMAERGGGRQGGDRHRGKGISILGFYAKKRDEKASSVLWCKEVLPPIQACRGLQENDNCSYSPLSPFFDFPESPGRCTHELPLMHGMAGPFEMFPPTNGKGGPFEQLLMAGRGGGRQGGGRHSRGGVSILQSYAKKVGEKENDCPSSVPQSGSACSIPDLLCPYDLGFYDCYGPYGDFDYGTHADCNYNENIKGHEWHIAVVDHGCKAELFCLNNVTQFFFGGP